MKALHFRTTRGQFLAMVALCVLINFTVTGARAQSAHGINSDGTDFFLGMMPTLAPHQGWQIRGHQYFLITSYFSSNEIQVDYFSEGQQPNGSHELSGKTYILGKGQSAQFMIDEFSMAPSYPGELPEYKACHIHSKYPISVQYYSDGSSSGSLYQGIPTAALGTNYVVGAWNDLPLADSPNPENEDSASSEFEIIAPYDNTHVTFTPNSTTYRGVVGVSTGAGSDGKTQHPVTVLLNRGQVYWVRSLPEDISDDMSGSTVVSDKPVAVLGGCELMLNGDMQAFDENIANSAVEEMTPVQDWGSDYPSIPTMPASNSGCNANGDGDYYRVFTNQPKGIGAYIWTTNGIQGPGSVAPYMPIPQNWQNVDDGVDLVTDTNKVGPRHTMYAMQCLYFQGIPSDEESDRAPELMNLIPIDRFRLSSAFMVPSNSTYHGAQYINVITNKDSLQKVYIYRNGGSPASLMAYSPKKTYTIPGHPELAGVTIQLTSASYLITGNTPFAAWSYGRTEPLTKDVWGYGAPIGQGYGAYNGAPGPKAVITPSCGEWDIQVSDTSGIADAMLLNDPDGFITRPPYISTNCRMYPKDLQDLTPPFEVGQKSLDVQIQVDNPKDTAFAALYIVDRSGNDTVIQLHYVAPSVETSDTNVALPNLGVGDSEFQTFTFYVNSTGVYDSIAIGPATWMGLDKTGSFSFTTHPKLPASLRAGDSVVFTVSYAASDTDVHKDSIIIAAGCSNDTVGVIGRGLTPIIVAGDWDFGNVNVGDTVCHDLTVQNVGNANLILDSAWVQTLNPDYTFRGPIPDTIAPGGIKTEKVLEFCFHPGTTGPSDSHENWGTNLVGLYEHQKKDTSLLQGIGIKPGMHWDRPRQLFTVKCDSYDTVRMYLLNTSSGPNGARLHVNDIHLIGDTSEFTIIADTAGFLPSPSNQQQWLLPEGDSIHWVEVQFRANLSNGYGNRSATLIANASDDPGNPYTDSVFCTGVIRHAIVAFNPPSFDFGLQMPGSQTIHSFTITNTGDTSFIFKGLNVSTQDFKILSGPNAGDSLGVGATDTIVLQFTSKLTGGMSFDTTQIQDGICAETGFMASGGSLLDSVAASGATYPTTFICHNGIDSVATWNPGTVPMFLDSVQILDNSFGTDASQFTFTATNSQLINTPLILNRQQRISFPVQYTPNSKGQVNAIAVFYYKDTAYYADSTILDHTRYFTVTEPITGSGYATANTLALANPMTANGEYSAVTANQVSIPVRLIAPFDSIAQIYGMQFTLRYEGDLFVFKQPVQPAAGLQLLNNPQPTADPTNSKYDLLNIQLGRTGTPFTDTGAVATVNWQYVIAKDSITPFQIQDLMFTTSDGSSVCWVTKDSVPTSFYGKNLCGDATLRDYLKGGLPVLSVGSVVPNPVKRTAAVNFNVLEEGVPVTLEVYNALGQPVKTLMKDAPHAKGTYRATIDASDLPSGLYTIFLSTPGYGISKQVVVTK